MSHEWCLLDISTQEEDKFRNAVIYSKSLISSDTNQMTVYHFHVLFPALQRVNVLFQTVMMFRN